MSLESFLSGEFLQQEKMEKRLLLLIFAFILILIYITIGYRMQNMKQQEIKLQNDYQKLHGTAVITHKKMVDETDIDNIKALIAKYKLNITTQQVSPIIVKK